MIGENRILEGGSRLVESEEKTSFTTAMFCMIVIIPQRAWNSALRDGKGNYLHEWEITTLISPV